MLDNANSRKLRDRFADGRLDARIWIGKILGAALDKPQQQEPKELAAIYNQSAFLGTKAILIDVIASDAPRKIQSQQDESASLMASSAMVDMFDRTMNIGNEYARQNVVRDYMERLFLIGWKAELRLQHLKISIAESAVQDDQPALADGIALFREHLENVIDKIDHHIATESKRRYTNIDEFVTDMKAFPQTEDHFNAEIRTCDLNGS